MVVSSVMRAAMAMGGGGGQTMRLWTGVVVGGLSGSWGDAGDPVGGPVGSHAGSGTCCRAGVRAMAAGGMGVSAYEDVDTLRQMTSYVEISRFQYSGI